MQTNSFAFIVHSRDRSDLPRKYPILKYLPRRLFDYLTVRLPPFVVSQISGLKNKNGTSINGLLIGIPMTAHQLLEDRELALDKILQAINLARSKGAKYIGLGAMTSSLSSGGRDIISKTSDVLITTGRTYTIKNITDYVMFIVSRYNLDINNIKIAIVGAAGGIGSGVAMLLAKKGFKKFLLIDLDRKLNFLRERIVEINKFGENLDIEISHQVSGLQSSNIIVAATSAPEVVIRSSDVSPGTIIINDAQPSDISPEIINFRDDVLVIEGGVLSAPGINCHFNMGLANKSDIFSCLAETLIMAHSMDNHHYSIENLDLRFLKKISVTGKNLRFDVRNIQNSSGMIPAHKIKKVLKLLKNK